VPAKAVGAALSQSQYIPHSFDQNGRATLTWSSRKIDLEH